MKKNWKVSVIVPVYNLEKYLGKCVESLLAQTYPNMEILLVDDGSQDTSPALCDSYAQRDARVRAIHKENGGLVSAWKRGVEEAAGDYLSFVDGDDWVDDRMLEEMAAFLTGSQKEIVSSDYVIEKEGGRQTYVWQQLPAGEYIGEGLKKEVVPQLLGNEERYVCMSRCMKLISRELILKNMHYSDPSIRMGEDSTILLPALFDCERLVIMDHKAYYHYLYVESSMIHQYDAGLFDNIVRLRAIVDRIVADKFAGTQREEMHRQAQKEGIFWLLLVLKNEARGNPKNFLKNIRIICKKDEICQLVRQYPVTVRQMSNRLLYAVLKHPNPILIAALRMAMILYYRRGSL